MDENQRTIIDKVVHVDSLKNLKQCIEKQQDDYESSTTNHIDVAINKIQTDLDEFKTQIQTDNSAFKTQVEDYLDEFKTQIQTDNSAFKTQVEDYLDETTPSVGGATIFNMNLELIPQGTEWTKGSLSHNLLNKTTSYNRKYSGYYENYNADNLYTFDELVEALRTHAHCTVVIKKGTRESIHTGCEVYYDSITRDGITYSQGDIYIYSAGLVISFYRSFGSDGVVKNNLSARLGYYASSSTESLTLTRLEFRGE